MLLTDVLREIEDGRLLAYDGSVDAANLRLKKIRAEVDVYGSSRVTGELKLLEGLLAQTVGDWALASDCFRRAEILGRLAGSGDLVGFAFAWQSHCACNNGSTLKAVQALIEAASYLNSSRMEMRHRFSMVAAELSSFAGELDFSRQWFDCARRIAGTLGSRGLFSAAIFNQSALNAWWFVLRARHSRFEDRLPVVDPLVFLQSASNYDEMSGVSVRIDLHEVVRAQVLGVAGEHDEALLVLNGLIREKDDLGPLDRSRVILEIVWNRLRQSNSSEDVSLLQKMVLESFHDLVDEDDLSFGHALMARLSEIAKDNESSSQHERSSIHYMDVLELRQTQVASALREGGLLDSAIVQRLTKVSHR